MNTEAYLTTQYQLVMMAKLITLVDLDGFVERIQLADRLGAVLDPTLYRQAGKKLDDVKRLAEAAQIFREEALRQIRESNPDAAPKTGCG